MSDENKAMRLRLEASKLGEWVDDRGNPDAEVYMFSFDDVCTFAASEVAAALALAKQEKQSLRAEVERKDAAIREWRDAEQDLFDQDGSDAANRRMEIAEQALTAALSEIVDPVKAQP